MDYGGDGLGVIYKVWEGLRGHDHVVPAAGGCGWRCGCVVDGGVDRVRGEGVGTEVAGFELYAGFEYGGVVGAADERDMDVEGGL